MILNWNLIGVGIAALFFGGSSLAAEAVAVTRTEKSVPVFGNSGIRVDVFDDTFDDFSGAIWKADYTRLRLEQIKKRMRRENPDVSDTLIDDLGRFTHDGIERYITELPADEVQDNLLEETFSFPAPVLARRYAENVMRATIASRPGSHSWSVVEPFECLANPLRYISGRSSARACFA